MGELNWKQRIDLDRLWDDLDLSLEKIRCGITVISLAQQIGIDSKSSAILKKLNNNYFVDSLALKIFERFIDRDTDDTTHKALVKKCSELNIKGPVDIECINKLRTSTNKILYHVVSIKNVSMDQILHGCGLVIAYHFTTESLAQRLQNDDDTYLDVPLLALRITTSKESETPCTLKSIIQKVLEKNSFISLKKLRAVTSTFLNSSDDKCLGLKENLFDEYIEETLLERYFLVFAKPLVYLLAAEQVVLWVHNMSAKLPELPEKADIKQDVCFSPHGGSFAKADPYVCCRLHEDLTVKCCAFDDTQVTLGGQPHCVSLNILDNDNPLHNCCLINEFDKIVCSENICNDSRATRAPCGVGGELIGRVSSKDTYNQKHYDLQTSIKNLRTEIARDLGHASDNDLIYSRILGIAEYATPEKEITEQLRIVSDNLIIQKPHRIQKLSITALPDMASVYSDCVNLCNYACSLTLSNRYTMLPQMDYVLGHEVAHIQQAQSLAAQSGALDYTRIRPGYEMSADILGILAANYTNGASVGAQWIAYNQGTSITPCRLKPVEISHANVMTIKNLLGTHDAKYPHPSREVRGTILLKLSTMIKAAVRYLEQNFKLQKAVINS